MYGWTEGRAGRGVRKIIGLKVLGQVKLADDANDFPSVSPAHMLYPSTPG